jgi:hypothetical protein
MNVVKEDVNIDVQLQRILRTEDYKLCKYIRWLMIWYSHNISLVCSSEVLDYLRSFPNDDYIKAVVLAKKFQRPVKKKKEDKTEQKADFKLANESIIEALGENNSRKFIVALGDNALRNFIYEKYPHTPCLRVIRETIAIDAPHKHAKQLVKQKETKVVQTFSQLTPWEREQLAKLQDGDNESVLKTDIKASTTIATSTQEEQSDDEEENEEEADENTTSE